MPQNIYFTYIFLRSRSEPKRVCERMKGFHRRLSFNLFIRGEWRLCDARIVAAVDSRRLLHTITGPDVKSSGWCTPQLSDRSDYSLQKKKKKSNIFKETESETFQLRSEDFKANEWCVAVFAEKKTAKSVVCPHVGPQLCFFYHMDTKLWAKESHEMLNEIKKQNAASQKICFYSKKNHQSPRYYTFKRF